MAERDRRDLCVVRSVELSGSDAGPLEHGSSLAGRQPCRIVAVPAVESLPFLVVPWSSRAVVFGCKFVFFGTKHLGTGPSGGAKFDENSPLAVVNEGVRNSDPLALSIIQSCVRPKPDQPPVAVSDGEALGSGSRPSPHCGPVS